MPADIGRRARIQTGRHSVLGTVALMSSTVARYFLYVDGPHILQLQIKACCREQHDSHQGTGRFTIRLAAVTPWKRRCGKRPASLVGLSATPEQPRSAGTVASVPRLNAANHSTGQSPNRT